MAYRITDDCTLCGACEEECPNKAISQPDPDEPYQIDPEKCTECVGFFDEPQCVPVCPSEAIILEPAEDERTLIERAKAIHPDKDFGEEFPSHLKK